MKDLNDEVKEFCRKYDALIAPSHKVHRRVRRLDYTVFKENGPEIWNRVPYEDVPTVEIHMPEDRFRALIEHDEWLYNAQMSNYIKGNEAVWLVEQHDRETRIRHSNPAVQKAWEKYQMLLTLVDSHYQ